MPQEMARLRPHAIPTNQFRFGAQLIRTKVNLMVPAEAANTIVDVTAAMYEPTIGHDVLDDVFEESK